MFFMPCGYLKWGSHPAVVTPVVSDTALQASVVGLSAESAPGTFGKISQGGYSKDTRRNSLRASQGYSTGFFAVFAAVGGSRDTRPDSLRPSLGLGTPAILGGASLKVGPQGTKPWREGEEAGSMVDLTSSNPAPRVGKKP